MLEFAQPQWLWIGAVACCVAVALLVRADRKRRAVIARFAAASPETSVGRRRRVLRYALLIGGLAMASGAMARPIAGFRWEQQPEQGVDIMFAVDTSKSMLAADVRPARLTRAKLAVADLARTLDGDRLGLVAFAGNAFVQAPMTVDRGVFLEALDALDTTVIPRGGSDLASAIRAGEQAMRSEPGHRKVLVMLSDGEDLAGNVGDAARDAAKRGVAIYTVGVGTRQGELIQTIDENGRGELVRDEHGEPVRSKLDEATLRSVAQLTGGAYASLGADGRGLETIVAAAKADLPSSMAEGTRRKIYVERYQIPLAFALGCLLVELVLGDRRRRRDTVRASALAMGALVLGVPQIANAESAPPAASSYNRGTETYRRGEFEAAGRELESALRTDDIQLQIDTYYNLGNARYRIGQGTLAKQDRDATIATWRRALEAYDAALALAPGDADAKFNRALVSKKLAELEQDARRDQTTKNKQSQPEQKQAGQSQQQQNQKGAGQDERQSGNDQQQNQPRREGQPEKPPGQGQQQNQTGQQGKPEKQADKGQQQDPSDRGQQRQSSDDAGAGKQPSNDQARRDPGQEGRRPESSNAPDPAGQRPRGSSERAEDQRDDDHGDKHTEAARTRHDSSPKARGERNGEKQQPDTRAADTARRAAGQLTHTEAVQLLDSIADELRPLPIEGGKPNHTEDKIKDW